MAQTRASDRTTRQRTGRSGPALTIEKGWTVYDALGRPVGNVTDVDTAVSQIEVDGRPAGFASFSVPFESIRQAGDNEVHLAVAFEPSHSTPGTVPHLKPVDDTTTSGASVQAARQAATAAPAAASTTRAPDAPARPDASTRAAAVADRSAHGPAPVWTEEENHTSYGTWIAGAGAILVGGAAAAGAYYLRQRRRKTAAQRFMLAASGFARDRHPAWWGGLAAAGLPLAYYALAGRHSSSQAAEVVRERTGSDRLADLIESLSGSGSSLLTDVSSYVPSYGDLFDGDDRSPLWDLALPGGLLAVSALALWLANRRSAGGSARVGDVMTRGPRVVRPDATVAEAASMLRRLDVGALPVCDGSRLVGMITDRDIAVRSTADGRDPQLSYVRDVMSSGVNWSTEDASVEEAARIMREHQIRRLPIVDERKNLVGIVSLGDLAVDVAQDEIAGDTLERISEPSRPRR